MSECASWFSGDVPQVPGQGSFGCSSEPGPAPVGHAPLLLSMQRVLQPVTVTVMVMDHSSRNWLADEQMNQVGYWGSAAGSWPGVVWLLQGAGASTSGARTCMFI
jgi:hypothetical protein